MSQLSQPVGHQRYVTVTRDDNLWVALVDGRDVTDALSRFMAAERELREVMAEEAAKAAARDAARLDAINAVRSVGLSQRVAADVVGLSHQRVHQLVNSQAK